MAQPVWITPAGDLGTIAENLFFQVPIEATDPDGPKVLYSLIAGKLPEGVQVTKNGSIEGVPLAYARVKGVPTEVAENVHQVLQYEPLAQLMARSMTEHLV